MGEILSSGTCVTRKEHDCFGCCRTFEKGSTMHYCNYATDGTVNTSYMCEVCQVLVNENHSYGDEISDGEIKDNAPEYWEQKRAEIEKTWNCWNCGEYTANEQNNCQNCDTLKESVEYE